MELAEEIERASGGEVPADFGLCRQVDVEALVSGRDGVAEDVVVLPDDDVADVKLGGQGAELELEARRAGGRT
jgi:hypothetical protein